MQNRLEIRQNLRKILEYIKQDKDMLYDAPIIDLELSARQVSAIESLTVNLENLNSYPRPLLYGSNLLDGAWLLQYSNAREIRNLKNLPLGCITGKVYQTIDVSNASFENKAWVEHSSKLLSGYVRVTATFEPAIEEQDSLPNSKINVNFQQSFFSLTKIFGIKTSLFDPIRVVPARNPQGRIASLDTTYIDDTMRIGRGGEGSLFILTKV